MSNYNRISQGRSPNNIPFINENIDVLNKFSQQNGFVYFNGHRLGNSLNVTQYNNESFTSNSNSSYNISFSNIQNIVFQGAEVKINPYNNKQVKVIFDKIENYIGQENLLITSNDYYKIKEINFQNYSASAKQYLICNGENSTVIKLPSSAKQMDYIKIATLGKINTENTVTVVVSSINTYINSTNQTSLVIDSPYSSVELVFSASTYTWMIITPFVPMQRNTAGLTTQQAVKAAKKQMLIFG